MDSGAKDWVIRKSGYFYRPNRCGYTASIFEAGRYTQAEAQAEVAHEPNCMSAWRASEFEPAGLDEELRVWFNSFPHDGGSKEFDRLMEIVKQPR